VKEALPRPSPLGVLDLLDVYEEMRRLRLFEKEVGTAVAAGEIHGEMHLAMGYEAVAVALRRHLRAGDAVVSTHRAHLHALAAGVDPIEMAAELLERDGLNHGKGGHMHLFDPAARFMCTGIVGAGVPIASGYALAQSLQGTRALTVAVVGDGTMNQGAVFETMNLAAVRALPMVFLCEDNGYSISVRRADSTAGDLSQRGQPFGIPGLACDGTDIGEVDETMARAFEITRTDRRPVLVVASVYRFRGHYEGDLDLYRPDAEKKEAALAKDPIVRLRQRLLDSGTPRAELDAAEARAAQVVRDWFASARRRPLPAPESARQHVFAGDHD
jgi:acetoin:2,6-dichlorophenolindophenol oxidoreductase subunit alpha